MMATPLVTQCCFVPVASGSDMLSGYAPGYVSRRIPSFRTLAKRPSWGGRLIIGAVVATPTILYLTPCVEAHKHGVIFKPGRWYRDDYYSLARPWQPPDEERPLGRPPVPLLHSLEVLLNGTILMLFRFKKATGCRAYLLMVRSECEFLRGKHTKALESRNRATRMALRAPPTTMNKWFAACVLTEECDFRAYLDYPTSNLVEARQTARNLMIQSCEGEEGDWEVVYMTIELARAYGLVGNHEKKKELLHRAGQLQERLPEPDHVWFIRRRLFLASAHVMLGEWEQAEEIVFDIVYRTLPRARNLTDHQIITILMPLLRALAIIGIERGKERITVICLEECIDRLFKLSKSSKQFEGLLAGSAVWADRARVCLAISGRGLLEKGLVERSADATRGCTAQASRYLLAANSLVEQDMAGPVLYVVDRLEPEEEAKQAKQKAEEKPKGSGERDEPAERRRKYLLQRLLYTNELVKLAHIQRLMAEGKTKPKDHPDMMHEVGEEQEGAALEEMARQLLTKINCRGAFSAVPVHLEPEAMLNRVEAGRLLEDLGSIYR